MSALLTAQQVCDALKPYRAIRLLTIAVVWEGLSTSYYWQRRAGRTCNITELHSCNLREDYASCVVLFTNYMTAVQEIGCLIGALSNLWIGDKLGRRRTIVLGGVIMIVGAILQASSFSYAQLVVARIVTGLGNGLNVCVKISESTRGYWIWVACRLQLCRLIMQNVRRRRNEEVLLWLKGVLLRLVSCFRTCDLTSCRSYHLSTALRMLDT